MAFTSLAVLALCGLARPAAAAVVTLERQQLRFVATPGEANDVTVTFSFAPGSTAGEALVSDLGAPLDAGGRCTAVDEYSATCPVARAGLHLAVALGDGDDAARLVGRIHLQTRDRPSRLAGGPGADLISLEALVPDDARNVDVVGHGGDDTLLGGRFPEVFYPGPGDDVIRAGRNSDTIWEGPGNDRINGGPDGIFDYEIVGYRGAPRAIAADLSTRLISGWGRDRVREIEWIFGSRFNDRLIGDRHENWLSGGRGNDRLWGKRGDDVFFGRGGDDSLFGGSGADSFSGGGGDDVLVGGGGREFYMLGGSGDDVFFARDGLRDRRLSGDRGNDCGLFDTGLDRPDVESLSLSCSRGATARRIAP